ncbi:MAG: endonuclease III [Candidatus Micrarchaeaceae archaeon]
MVKTSIENKKKPIGKRDRKAYANMVLKLLKKRYSNELHTSLGYSSAWELLVATILSAQSSDVQVNKVTPPLFKKYPSINAFAHLHPSDLYAYVKTLGLYRSKSRNIILSARRIIRSFGGKVPSSIEELTSLPGVGRKTANVVLSNIFGKNEGIAIDTHCIITSNRLGLVNTTKPEKIESALMELFPNNEWGNVSHALIALGRDVCRARAKYCEKCVLRRLCPSSTFNFARNK